MLRRHRPIWKALLIVVGLVVLGILISYVHHLRLRAAVNSYISQLKARGEPMELSQVIPAPAPDEKNGAATFRKVAALIADDRSLLQTNWAETMQMVAPGKAMIGWKQPEYRDDYITNSWAALEHAVVQNRKSFQLLLELTNRPVLDFGINYQDGVVWLAFSNLFLAELKAGTERLETAALCSLHRGDAASAVKDVRAAFALIKGMRHERLVISELVRIAMTHLTMGITWELLQADLTDKQLAVLQADWQGIEFVNAYENSVAMERLTSAISIEKARAGKEELPFGAWDRKAETLHGKMQAGLWRYWWSYSDELRAMKGEQALIEAVRFAETNGDFNSAISNQQVAFKAIGVGVVENPFGNFVKEIFNPDLRSPLSDSVATLAATFPKVMVAEAGRRMTITAIALRRYQMKNGEYPADLDALTPEFIQAIPRDPRDGKPLRYRRQAEGGFLLYSIGKDGKDDGGNPNPTQDSDSDYWLNARDWVWPQPASRDEMEANGETRQKQ